MDKIIDLIKKSDIKTKVIAVGALLLVILSTVIFGSGGEEGKPSADGTVAPVSQSEAAEEAPQTETPDGREEAVPEEAPQEQTAPALDENGSYTTKDDVALYLHLYHRLPVNFITKNAARDFGWEGGSLEPYAPGKCIGGDYFGNYEGLLPSADGRKYTECDINTLGANGRGGERIVFSNDGLIYYTGDHYETFTLLYDDTGTW